MRQPEIKLPKASDIRISGRFSLRHTTNVDYLLRIHSQYGEGMLAPFRHRGRWREVGFSRTRGWDGEYAFKWLDAATKTAATTGHDLLTGQVNAFAKSLRSLQETDGYMGIEDADQKGKAEWDVWNQWYALTGWLTHYELMGDDESLAAAAGVGEWLVKAYEPIKSSDAWFFKGALHGGCNVDVMDQLVRLYEHTGKQSLLDFVGQVIEHYPAISTMQDSGKALTVIGGHDGEAPDKMHAYVLLAYLGGIVNYAVATGQKQELGWIESVWEDIVNTHLYPTYSLGYKEDLRSDAPNDSPDMDLQETCATVEWLIFNGRLYRATGRVRYAHMVEGVIYNALLGAQSPDGTKWNYFTPLRYHKRWGSGPTHCCYWSGPRGIAMVPELIYASDDDGLYVNLFESSQAKIDLKGTDVTVAQTTDYPADGSTSLKIGLKKPHRLTVRLRIPPWARSVRLTVNGKSMPTEVEAGQYVTLNRVWANGDLVKMDFEIPTTLRAMGRYGLVVSRGPEVMSLDSRDNERHFLDTAMMDNVRLPADLTLASAESKGGRRVYTGQVSVGGKPQTATFTPFADAGATVVPHESIPGPLMYFSDEGACYRTVFLEA